MILLDIIVPVDVLSFGGTSIDTDGVMSQYPYNCDDNTLKQ